ncbi:MAG: hypothetical protein AB7N76_06570 [Planctomycetota bacterium]
MAIRETRRPWDPPPPGRLVPDLLRALGLGVVMLFACALICSCGHFGREHLALLPLTALAAFWTARRPRPLLFAPLVLIGCLGSTKALLDVGWRGHEPLLGGDPPAALLLVSVDTGLFVSLCAVAALAVVYLRARAADRTTDQDQEPPLA